MATPTETVIAQEQTNSVDIAETLNILTALDEASKAHYTSMRAQIAQLKKNVKTLQKQLKVAEANQKKPKKAKDPNAPKRKPAGFAKPTRMSAALCDFLGVAHDTEIPRTEVTKMLTQYIKQNELQNPDNKREIKMDDKLSTLLNPPNDVTITFFTLQTYMKPHFVKTDDVAEAPPAPVASSSSSASSSSKPVDSSAPPKKKVIVKKKGVKA